MVEAFGDLNGSGNQQVWVYTARTAQAGNHSQYYYQVRYYGNGWGSFGNSGAWSYTSPYYYRDGTWAIPSSARYDSYTILADGYYDAEHDANGYLGAFNVRGAIDYNHTSIGKGEANVVEGAPPRIAKVPSKPAKPVFVKATPTTIEYQFYNSADNGGSAETNIQHVIGTDPNFGGALTFWDDTSSTATASGLAPGTMHYIMYRTQNAVGSSAWSDVLSQTTLPAVAPGMTISGNPAGDIATLVFSPPGGSSGVTKYTWERRVTGTVTPVVSTDGASGTSYNVTGLTPGTSYDWRASAWFGAYQSPWTAWTPFVMAKPNTAPGEYFDGVGPGGVAPPAGSDVTYAWTGTAHLSTSQMLGKAVTGWTASFTGAAGTISRVTGGAAGSYAARAQFTRDATAAGALNAGGVSTAAQAAVVIPGSTYYGSIWVKPSKKQRLVVKLFWYTAAGASAGTAAVSTETVVEAGVWTRLSVSGVATATAAVAFVRVVDVVGTDYSAWMTGDYIDLDAAMITLQELFPYFDGDTTDDEFYRYDWTIPGSPHASTSSRTALVGGGVDPLDDPLCPPPPAPPRPPLVLSECIEPPSIWRRYWQSISQEEISDWLAVIPTVKIRSDASAQSQVRVRIYENPTAVPAASFTGIDEWISEQIISYMPAYTVITLDGVAQRAWAQVGSATVDPTTQALRPADKLLYGSDGTPPTWPVLSCGLDYLVSFDAPINSPADLRRFISLTERLG